MNVSDLDERFNVTQYEPDKDGRATVELVDGSVLVRVPYNFHTEDGSSTPQVKVTGVATAQQLDDLKIILSAVLLATNNEIESEHGWTKYVEVE